ncbi:hypothetical protein [Mucilaginibacter aquaedulcis]|uniref:hypothetical protein n=1 Tax=Mucilaginibacter aquaedulcis TaxID=1187081 RepID=UPI0025B53CFE|nr:hypothetical protein [Mucilaginibacter aquaedulcis]MDN3546757.1 hypothetical protein [Mucilaginibacter aquaedulcis]
MQNDEEFENVSGQGPEEAFHLEVDLTETGEYSDLLVIPCSDLFIMVHQNEHFCTVIKTCDDPVCWEQRDGYQEDEVIDRVTLALESYISQL